MPMTTESAFRKDRRAGGNVELQHRHFAFIADVIASMPDHAASLRTAKLSTASAFADACGRSNPRFDRARFFLACGVSDPRC